MYIGSSIDIGTRLVRHLVINNTNEHLQHAITKYGLENFSFCVVEFYEVNPSVSLETNKANLLALEQKHLDWLFTLPESLRYNYNPTAGSILGYIHSEETRAQISDSISGANNHMYGRTGALNPLYGKVPASAFQSGANNPMYGRTGPLNTMYGKVPANAITIDVYDLDNVLVHSFPSQVAAAKWLNIPRTTFQKFLSSGKVWNNQYKFRKSRS